MRDKVLSNHSFSTNKADRNKQTSVYKLSNSVQSSSKYLKNVAFTRMKTKVGRHHICMAKVQNCFSSNGISSDSVPTNYSKGAIKRLLDRVRKEKAEIRILSKPTSHVRNGKSRHKFPDPKKDCCIKLAVNCQSSKLSLPVSYFDYENDDHHLTGGLSYVVQVTAVRRFTCEGQEVSDDSPPNTLYCCCPLSEHKAGAKTKSLGFWFRFFGQPAKFLVTISLKLHGIKTVLRGTKDHSSLSFCGDNCLVYSVDVDISNIDCPHVASRSIITSKSKLKLIRQQPLLYACEGYKEAMRKVLELRHNQRYSELGNYLSSVLDSVSDCDIRVAAVLEQSLEMCRKGVFSKAKLRIKDAVDSSPKCKNKLLLIGRSYLYLSQVHEADGNLGSAEECLEIARKKLEGFQSCEDVGDLCFQEGVVLIAFAKRMSKFAWKLQQEAVAKFKEALLHYKDGVTATSMTEKLCRTHARLAILALFSMPNTDISATGSASVIENALVVLKQNIDKLSVRTKYLYFLCQAENYCQQDMFEEASKYLEEATSMKGVQGSNSDYPWSAALHQKISSHTGPPEKAELNIANSTNSLFRLTTGREDGYLGDNNSC